MSSKKGGKRNKTQMNKSQVKRQKEEEERRLQEEEEARLQQERREQERQEREKKEQELEMLELKDQERREGELNELHHLLEQNCAAATKWKIEATEKAKWERYRRCDNIPDPAVQQDINTYISLWRDDPEVNMSILLKQCELALQLVEEMEALLRGVTDAAEGLKYQETLVCLQELIHSKHNIAAEEILKDASGNTDMKGNMQAVVKDDNCTLCLWANLKKNPRLKGFHFEEVGLGFELPKQLVMCDIAVRILHTRYDHLSTLARMAHLTVHTPSCRSLLGVAEVLADADSPKQAGQHQDAEERYDTENATQTKAEEEVQSIQWSEGRKRSALSGQSFRASGLSVKDEAGHIQTQMEALSVEGGFTPSQVELNEEDNDETSQVVDLLQYTPLGGVFYFDLFHLPPQARHINGWEIRQVLNTGLQEFPYPVETPQIQGSFASNLDDPGAISGPPIGVFVRLPDSVVFLERPQVARWVADAKQWQRDGITEVCYEEAEAKISFKTDSFHAFTLMQHTYVNLPFQSWELRPLEPQDSALFTITGALIKLSITIQGNQCMLQSEQQKGLDHLTGKWMSGPVLQRAMINSGINIFVNEHTDKYVRTCSKDPLTEHAAYEQMALLAASCAFSWSQWNAKCGAEHLVMQVCEHHGLSPAPDDLWSLYLLGAQRSQKLKILEDSEAFSPEHCPGSELHSTFIHMLQVSMSAEAISRTSKSSYLFVDTVQSLLCNTRPLIYS